MTPAWVGLGSNIGDSAAYVAAGLSALESLPGTRLRARSRLYRSAPWGPVPQADFLNAVAWLDTNLAAPALLESLLAIEQRHGRRRDRRWGPRTLDLDILLYDDAVLATPTLTVPHPRLAERAFVLVPLAELAPELEVPGLGPVRRLLGRVDASEVVPVEDAA